MKLSIITVNYNNAEGLERTIQSVQSQTWKDYEHIIIDAASTDGSVDIIHKYSSGISKWVSEPDKGIYDGMNKGIEMANGEYCHFLNSGDWLVDEGVYGKVFENNFEEDIISCNLIYIDPVTKNQNEVKFASKFNLVSMNRYPVHHQASFIRTKLFDYIGKYDLNFRIAADYDFWLKCYKIKSIKWKKIDLPVVFFINEGISSKKNMEKNIQKERLQIKLNNFNFLEMLYVFTIMIARRIKPYSIEN